MTLTSPVRPRGVSQCRPGNGGYDWRVAGRAVTGRSAAPTNPLSELLQRRLHNSWQGQWLGEDGFACPTFLRIRAILT